MNIRILIAGSLILASVGASANIKFLGTDLGNGLGINYNGNGMNVFAGKLKFLNLNSNQQFLSVCGDLNNIISNGQQWNCSPVLTSTMGPNMQAAGHIVANAFSLPTNNDEATGLQVAVWEAVYDASTNAGTPDFTSGIFKSGVSGTALAKAQQYYAFVNSPGDAIYYAPNPSNAGQGQLTPVPEPGTVIALATGAAALLRKRRK